MAEQLTRFQIWYQKNKKKVAKKRKLKYHSDKKYRENNLKACRQWRADNKPWQKRQKEPRTYLLIGEFAREVGCVAETLRNLEDKGLIPKTTNGVARRRYNKANIARVAALVRYRQDHHYNAPGYAAKVEKLVKNIHAHWRKA